MQSTRRPFSSAVSSRDTDLARKFHASRRPPVIAAGVRCGRGMDVSRETQDLTEFMEGFPKPMEGQSKFLGRKIQILGKQIQSRGKRNPSFFLPGIETIQGLARESYLRSASPLPLARPPGASSGVSSRDAPAPHGPSCNPCPPSFQPRSRPFSGTNRYHNIDSEKMKHKSRKTSRLPAITHG